MEIGLGFGTLSQYMHAHAKKYVGVDYSEKPVWMANERIRMAGKGNESYGVQGDARKLDFPDQSFDTVVSIGCLHHTGDTQRAVSEVFRVLKPGGTAIIMLYNKNSFRRLFVNPYRYYVVKNRLGYADFAEYTRASYDANTKKEAAPIIDFYSRSGIKKLFHEFRSVSIQSENFDNYDFKPFDYSFIPWRSFFKTIKRTHCAWPREKFLNNIAKIWGLDLYMKAKK